MHTNIPEPEQKAAPANVATVQLATLFKHIVPVGALFDVRYDRSHLLTHDDWRSAAGGLSRYSFLLAVKTGNAANDEGIADAKSAVLLRIEEADLSEAVFAGRKDLKSALHRFLQANGSLNTSVEELGYSVADCRILGTFYDAVGPNGYSRLHFSTDIHTFDSRPGCVVCKPYGYALECIGSFPSILDDGERATGRDNEMIKVRLGTVRYSSSPALAEQGREYNAPVPVHVNALDFVSMKTAIFGITRSGKSNTMKTIAATVFEYAIKSRLQIGQIFFDPSGEYSNVNVLDETALTELGEEHVKIYRLGSPPESSPDRSVSINFFDSDYIEVVWELITRFLLPYDHYDTVKQFLVADVVGLDMTQRRGAEAGVTVPTNILTRRLALFAVFIKAGFVPAEDFAAAVPIRLDVLAVINQHLSFEHQFEPIGKDEHYLVMNAEEMCHFWDCVLRAKELNPRNKELGDWLESGLQAVLDIYAGREYLLLESLMVFHSADIGYDYVHDIYKNLMEGKIVVVDLSVGSDTVLQICAERIINHILDEGTKIFAGGKEPPSIQIFLEEAHRLFSRTQVLDAATTNDPYARLAKEAAKYNIGLIYATQEITSVNPLVLSNTANWVVSHLNSTAETDELSKYYAYGDFTDLIISARDVGFARVVTRSGRYIVPTQIDLFGPHRIAAIREQLEKVG